MQQFKISEIRTQGRMTVEEIQAQMTKYDGKAAPCDRKYRGYEPVDVPKVDLVTFLADLKDILKGT